MSTVDRALAGRRYLAAPTPAAAARQLPVAGLLVFAAALHLWHLSDGGYGNTYYAAAVRSMLQSWHNFFFAAYDPAGFISVDKPPLALWIQAASAKLLGYSSFSLLLPQALLGVASVLVLYLAVSRVFGRAAGLVAGLGLALTPISLAVSRLNHLETVLVFFVLLAAYGTLRALEPGSAGLRWLLLAAVAMGLAFNVKFLAAYVALPAMAAAYFIAAPVSLRARLGRLALAGVVLTLVSGAWIAAVELTPASKRPYVGGSRTNSALNLLVEYNGLDRLDGSDPYFPSGGRTLPGMSQPLPGPFSTGPLAQSQALFRAAFTGGSPGPLRLFQGQVAAQASWLAPLAVIGGLGVLLGVERGLRGNVELGSIVLWGGWLLTAFAVFSEAKGVFHPYYLSYLGPPMGAMAGIAVAGGWRALERGSRLALLTPAALLATAGLAVVILRRTPDFHSWLVPVVALTACAAAAVLVWQALSAKRDSRRAALALAVGVGAVLLAPLFWTRMVLTEPLNAALPFVAPAPPGLATPFASGAAAQADARLVAYLESQRGEGRFLAATESAANATPIIISTGEAVLPLGGFSGTDPATDLKAVTAMVEEGSLRFFLLGGVPLPAGPTRAANISRAVTMSCRPVEAALYGGPTGPGPGQFGPFGRPRLYDCRGAAAELRRFGG